jgi:hypothetical protein
MEKDFLLMVCHLYSTEAYRPGTLRLRRDVGRAVKDGMYMRRETVTMYGVPGFRCLESIIGELLLLYKVPTV